MPDVYKYIYYGENHPLTRLTVTPPMAHDAGTNVLDIQKLQVTEEELATLRRLGLVDVTIGDVVQPKVTAALEAERKIAQAQPERLRNKISRFLDLFTYC